jgi:TM2 domain/GYF domain 2
MQGRLYYLAQTDQVIGPFGKMQLRRMAADRQITPATMITTDGQPWIPIAQIPGIYSSRSRRTAIVLAFFGGVLGMDRFYLGKIGTGLAKLITLGGFGIWWMIDLLGLGARLTTDVNGLPLRK